MEKPSREGLPRLWPAAAVCALLGLYWAVSLTHVKSWGWDESMNAEMPAVRMLLAAQEGELRESAQVVLDCQQYPFVYPVALAAVQVFTGVSQSAARTFGRLVWALACFGLFLLGRELAAVQRGRAGPGRGDVLVPWLALTLGALSPLALSFSSTLFLETPFLTLAIFGLWAWIRRWTVPGATSELLAGLFLIAAFFTKFNYGLQLGFACFLELVIEAVHRTRAGALRRWLPSLGLLALVPVLGFAWWFLLPLPAGPAKGGEHRHAIVDYLLIDVVAERNIPWSDRLMWLGCFLVVTPRVLLLQAVGVARSLGEVARSGVRLLFLVLAVAWIPAFLHNYMLHRFLLPGAVALWLLAALGIARLVPVAPRARAVALGVLALGCLLLPRLDSELYFDAVYGFHEDDPQLPQPEREKLVALAQYQRDVIADFRSLSGARDYDTGGLDREAADAMLDLVHAVAGPDGRVAWLGINSEMPPAVIHLGLLERGGAAERFRRDAALLRPDGEPDMCLSFRGEDPQWSPERLLAWARAFDVVITTRPVDFKGRAARDYIVRYQKMLV
ncbi:MAG: hypothetical protein O7B99_10995 [Planctomycetota bacterium]|nr:hypothetical protein [Planctomycetota bacterium]